MGDKPKLAIPRHIGMIMDGNGRWAKKRLMPRTAGHKAGIKRVRDAVEACGELGVEALTVYAFSSENWARPEEEVGFLMNLFVKTLAQEIDALHKNNVQFKAIGDLSVLAENLQEGIRKGEALTENNTGLKFRIAINYGSQWEILDATKKIAEAFKANEVNSDEINESLFESKLTTHDLPPLDLLIRTSGEHRISNFLLWQAAYAEFYFTQTLWPDFDRKAFDEALLYFSKRERRFGTA